MATDQITQIITLLNDNWNAGTVAKPKIINVSDESMPRRRDLRQGDIIEIYEANYDYEIADIGAHATSDISLYTLDIKTARNRQRMLELLSETERIILENMKFPFSGTHLINPVRRVDLSSKMVKMHRITYDINLINAYRSIN